MDHWINIIPILIIVAASFFVIQSDSWKKILPGYAVMFLSGFSIIVQFWSLPFSLVKLLTGLMALTILGVSIEKHLNQSVARTKAERIFRMVAFGMVLLVVGFIVEGVSSYLSIPLEIALASLVIIGLSLVQLGISYEVYKISLSLIILFFGFELIFSTNETSLLINGLLSLLSLLVSLMAGYIIVNEHEGQEE